MTGERLRNHRLDGARATPAAIVAALGAVQAQDFGAAKWALGLRARNATERDVQRAIDDGAIVRTHAMRGTHHFVAPADLRWLVGLLAPRSLQLMAGPLRRLGLDERTLVRALTTVGRALEGGNQLGRAETAAALRRAKISADGLRLAFIVMYAEVTGLVCSGALRDKEVTIALVDDRIPRTPALDRPAALAELAKRYFATRGPATVYDFAWWSSLTIADARAAIALADLAGTALVTGPSRRGGRMPRAHLLPAFDEYTVAYRDRSAAGAAPRRVATESERWLLAPNVLIDGVVAGTWKRTIRNSVVAIDIHPWRALAAPERAAIADAAAAYGRFLGLEPRITVGATAASRRRRP